MRSISCWGAVALLAALIVFGTPASAQPIAPGAVFYTLTDLQTIFVRNQQYFVFDNEGTSNPQLNHLHIAQLNTTTGAFEGQLVSPTLPETFSVPVQAAVITGTITINPGTDSDIATGNFYGISFSWALTVGACEDLGADYTGAITFQGYEGSGKMHAVIAGTENANWGACGVGSAVFNPLPFSGQLTK
jgi:hypothetical protein